VEDSDGKYKNKIKLNKMSINVTLKFSWGHIFAFIALIFISYVSFLGLTYLTDGNFIYAGCGAFIIDVILILFFIVPQLLKGTDHKFGRRIIIERILICMAPFAFAAAMVPFIHFWRVFDNRKEVELTFSESMKGTKEMFETYEDYSEKRLKLFEESLIAQNVCHVRIQNSIEALRLQILSRNFTELKKSANDWLDKAADATVWNAFMIGNIDQIESAIDEWSNSLYKFSSNVMTTEPVDSSEYYRNTLVFGKEHPSFNKAKENFENLRNIYTTLKAPTVLAIGLCVLMYLMLMSPYFLQDRNTKVRNNIHLFKCSKHLDKSDDAGEKSAAVEDDKKASKSYDSFNM
jgi:hypothetical protein